MGKTITAMTVIPKTNRSQAQRVYNERTQTTDSDLIVAGDHNLDINRSNPLVHDIPHGAYDISSVETDNLQRTDPTDPIANANDSEEAPVEIAESSEQPLAAMTASVSKLN